MTTIAYRSQIMAADSACGRAETSEHSVRKIFRIHGALVGSAGTVSEIFKFRRWLKDGADPNYYPRIIDDFDAIVVQPSGKILIFDKQTDEGIIVKSLYIAIGNGTDIALGAMFAGADAVTAVRAAVKHNLWTKGPVRSYRLHE